MHRISQEAVNVIAARIAYPECQAVVKGTPADTKAELKQAEEEYHDVVARIQEEEIKEALDDALGAYIAALMDHYTQIGVKQGIRFVLDMLAEGGISE